MGGRAFSHAGGARGKRSRAGRGPPDVNRGWRPLGNHKRGKTFPGRSHHLASRPRSGPATGAARRGRKMLSSGAQQVAREEVKWPQVALAGLCLICTLESLPPSWSLSLDHMGRRSGFSPLLTPSSNAPDPQSLRHLFTTPAFLPFFSLCAVSGTWLRPLQASTSSHTRS